jgi:hypothetical protein
LYKLFTFNSNLSITPWKNLFSILLRPCKDGGSRVCTSYIHTIKVPNGELYKFIVLLIFGYSKANYRKLKAVSPPGKPVFTQ